jgi:hypothetical protein
VQKYELSKSKKLAAKVVYAALKLLKENGGELSGREVIEKVGRVFSWTSGQKRGMKKLEIFDGNQHYNFLALIV